MPSETRGRRAMENPPPRIRVAVALEEEGKVLLIRHQKGSKTYWLVPGGGVEYGESVRQAAVREMQEETGLDVQVDELAMVAESLAPDHSRHVLHLVFKGRQTGGQLRLGREDNLPEDDQRLAELRWVPLAEISQLVMHPPCAQAFCDSLRGPTKFIDDLWID